MRTVDNVVGAGDSGGGWFTGDPDVGPIQIVGVTQGRYETTDIFTKGQALQKPNLGSFLLHTEFDGVVVGTRRVYCGPVDVPPLGEPGRPGFVARDLDGDGLFDEHDDCPKRFDPMQIDADGDGVGDVSWECRTTARPPAFPTVTCATPDSDGDGVLDPCDNCPLRNADQADSDHDGIGDRCVCWRPGAPADHCEVDDDRDGIPDDSDACPLGSSVNNTNIDGEIADSVTRALLDPCDPNPSATGDWPPTPTPPFVSNAFVGGEGLITTATAGSTLSAQMVTGFRFCPCAAVVAGGRTVTRACTDAVAAGGAGCSIDEPQYAAVPTETKWRPMDLEFTLPPHVTGSEATISYGTPDPTGHDGPSTYSATWNFEADAAGVVEPVPGGGARVRGVFWDTARSYASCSVPGACAAVPNGNLNSHYSSAIIERLPPSFVRAAEGWSPIAGLVPVRLFGDPICPACENAFPAPWLSAGPACTDPSGLCPPTAVFLRVSGLDVKVTGQVSVTAARALANPAIRWLAPAEPREYLGGATVTLLGIDAGTLVPRHVLVTSGGMLRTSFEVQDKIDPPGAFPLLRATRDEYMLVGGDGAPGAIPSVNVRTGETRWTVLHGALPERVLAAAVDAVYARLLVLDVVAPLHGRGDDVRLLLVDLEDGACTELARHRRTGGFDAYALASAPGAGQFVLAASNATAMRHSLVHLEVDPEGRAVVRGLRPADGQVIGQMLADRRGISQVVRRRGAATWESVGTAWVDFLPASGRALDVAF